MIITTPQTLQHQVLDPCFLGRPLHLLHIFAAQLRDDLAQALRLHMNRRYWGAFQVEQVGFSRAEGGESKSRWFSYAAPAGAIGFALERGLLLGVLSYRYDRSKTAMLEDESEIRVTATEERLAVTLGQQLASTLIRRIDLNLVPKQAASVEPKAVPGAQQPAPGTWMVSVTMRNASDGQQGQFWFSLEKDSMSSVLRGLQPQRHREKKAQKSVQPLAARLQVSLAGRLVSKEVLLGSLFDLRVGDVIPISINRADVLLDESRVFTAAVTEHKGKLCLTSFEDAE